MFSIDKINNINLEFFYKNNILRFDNFFSTKYRKFSFLPNFVLTFYKKVTLVYFFEEYLYEIIYGLSKNIKKSKVTLIHLYFKLRRKRPQIYSFDDNNNHIFSLTSYFILKRLGFRSRSKFIFNFYKEYTIILFNFVKYILKKLKVDMVFLFLDNFFIFNDFFFKFFSKKIKYLFIKETNKYCFVKTKKKRRIKKNLKKRLNRFILC